MYYKKLLTETNRKIRNICVHSLTIFPICLMLILFRFRRGAVWVCCGGHGGSVLLTHSSSRGRWTSRSVAFRSSSYPQSSNLCSEAVVDGVYKTLIFIQCSCFIAPMCGYMNCHCKEPVCFIQMLEGRLLIGFYVTLFDVVTYTVS